MSPCARFEVLTGVSPRICVFLDVMPCHRVHHPFITSGGTLLRSTQWHKSEYWNPFDITLEGQYLSFWCHLRGSVPSDNFLNCFVDTAPGRKLVRGTRIQESSVTMYFQKTSLSQMLYLSDNLAYFPYQVQDEPLFIIHHIDIMISVSGTNLLQSFREVSVS